MQTLQLKDIAAYLPYRLKFVIKDGTVLRMDVLQTRGYNVWAHQKYIRGMKDENDINYKFLSSQNCSGHGFYLRGIKPILRPMSDLIKPLEDRTIPLIELAKIAFTNRESDFSLEKNKVQISAGRHVYYLFYWNENEFCMIYSADLLGRIIPNQVQLFDYLNEHHFDYRGLINKGIAVDINTLKE